MLKLDIYALTDEIIQACKAELDKKLGSALQTMSWTDKQSYPEDKRNIANLSVSQVSLTCLKVSPLYHFATTGDILTCHIVLPMLCT